ncbi:MAG TPA: CBS domain-containing protein [Stellaceae bacterium]|nr:CBS domain-containing protein [Stellaceae bacterium]
MRIVPDIVHYQTLCILSLDDKTSHAAQVMAERHIGAVLITDSDQLVGICTERDITYKVVAKGLDPSNVAMRDIMTPHPATIAPSDAPTRALDLMRSLGCRHLPVVDGEQIVGMLSIRDLYAALHAELEDDLRMRDDYISGRSYSVG